MHSNIAELAYILTLLVVLSLISDFIKQGQEHKLRLFLKLRFTATLFVAFLLPFCSLATAGITAPKTTARESVRVVMDDNYPPYTFRDASGTLQGILVDQWTLWEKKTGIHVRLDAMDWAKAQQRMEAGDYDVIDTIFANEHRKTLYDFSASYATIDVPLFFSRELSGIRGPKDLKGFVVGAKNGDNSIQILKASGVSNFLFFDNYEAIVAAARDGKIKVFTIDKPPALYFLIKLGIQDQFRESVPLYSGEFRRAVRKGNTALLEDVQQGFNAITKGEYEDIERRWYGAPILSKARLTLVAFVVGGVVVIVCLLLLWVWLLRKSVRRRTAELQTDITERRHLETRIVKLSTQVPGVLYEYRLYPDGRSCFPYSSLGMMDIYEVMPEEVREDATLVFGRLHPEDRESIAAGIHESARTLELYHSEFRVLLPRQGLRWRECNAAPERMPDGGTLWYGIISDITARKQAEVALQESAAQNRALIHAIPDLIFVHDRDGRYLAIHASNPNLLILPSETLLHRSLKEVLPHPVAQQFMQTIGNALKSGVIQEVTYSLPLEGAEKHFEARVSPCTEDTVITLVRDVTERKQAEFVLRDTTQRLELATTSARMGVWDWDLQVETMIWDDRMFELYGASHGELQGTVQDWKDGLHPDDLERAVAECEAALRGETPFDTEFRLRHKDGTILWIKANAVVLRDHHGKPVRMIGLNQDITEQHKIQQQIRRLNMDLEERVKERTAQLESANKEMEAFSYSVSHDLRAPLRGIEGFSQALEEDYQDRLDETGNHYLSRIRAGTQRMGQLIDDLLKLSRVSRSEPIRVKNDLSDLCRKVMDGLAQSAPDRQIEVSIQPGLTVWADRQLLQVALENLLGNAWKYTSKSQAPSIKVGETIPSSGERVFFIQDNGSGFDMAQADKLFSAFQRLHSTNEFEGTGIGLSIVQRIVLRHGGRIWAEAEPEKGATFFFTLPDRGEA